MDGNAERAGATHRLRSEKAVLRRSALRRRAGRTDAERSAGRAGIAAALRRLPDVLPTSGTVTVCSYLPLGSEPLPPDAAALLTAGGLRVLLPVTRPDEPLDWREWRPGAETRPAAHGLDELAGTDLGAAAIRDAAAVLVPALLVDRAGRRLGRGGGYYDRSLALLDDAVSPAPGGRDGPPVPDGSGRSGGPAVPDGSGRPDGSGGAPLLIAVLFDDELVPEPLPVEAFDRPVQYAVTPSGGLTALGA